MPAFIDRFVSLTYHVFTTWAKHTTAVFNSFHLLSKQLYGNSLLYKINQISCYKSLQKLKGICIIYSSIASVAPKKQPKFMTRLVRYICITLCQSVFQRHWLIMPLVCFVIFCIQSTRYCICYPRIWFLPAGIINLDDGAQTSLQWDSCRVTSLLCGHSGCHVNRLNRGTLRRRGTYVDTCVTLILIGCGRTSRRSQVCNIQLGKTSAMVTSSFSVKLLMETSAYVVRLVTLYSHYKFEYLQIVYDFLVQEDVVKKGKALTVNYKSRLFFLLTQSEIMLKSINKLLIIKQSRSHFLHPFGQIWTAWTP